MTGKKTTDDLDLQKIYDLLLDMKETLDTHITEELVYKPKVIELVNILDGSKGVIWFLRTITPIAVIACGFIYWIKDHFKW